MCSNDANICPAISYHDKLSLAVSHVIESQYAHFLTLHRRQHHLLSLIQLLRPKLMALHGDMTEISHVIDTHVEQLHVTLTQRQALSTKKQLLRLFLDTEHSITQVERLIALFGNPPEDSDEDEVLILERIANQVTSVKYHVRAVRELPLMLKHAQRIQRIEQQLVALLARIMLHMLAEAPLPNKEGGHSEHLTPFDRLVTGVRIYRQLEDGSHVLNELLQSQFVRPRIEKLFLGIDVDDLRPLFDRLIQFTERELR